MRIKKIFLKDVVPLPLANNCSDSGVWGKKLDISASSIIEINAPSARGKTTLLSYIFGIRADYEGDISIDDTNIRSMKDSQWSAIRTDALSIVFQDLRLFDFLTGLENIIVKAALTHANNMQSIMAMAETLGVDSVLEKPACELSFGEKQRIAIIRSLVGDFSILLLDEHTSHLDKLQAKIANRLIRKRCAELHAGIICTTLDPSKALPFTTRIRL